MGIECFYGGAVFLRYLFPSVLLVDKILSRKLGEPDLSIAFIYDEFVVPDPQTVASSTPSTYPVVGPRVEEAAPVLLRPSTLPRKSR